MKIDVSSLTFAQRREAYLKIDFQKCIGCTRCRAQCPDDAIMGLRGCQHAILPNCSGCDLCRKKCPTQAIAWTTNEL